MLRIAGAVANMDESLEGLVHILGDDIDVLRQFLSQPKHRRRRSHIKIQDTLPTYLNMHASEFKRHLRCTPATFGKILEIVQPHLSDGILATDPRLRLMTGLAYFSSMESFREIAHKHGIADATAHTHVKEITDALVASAGKIIRFPANEEELAHVADSFMAKTGFPGIVGCVDGSYIPLDYIPDVAYINRKNTPSMILQAVCDHRMVFTSVFSGWPGRVHDSRVYKNSDLARTILPSLPENYHLVGDAAYPLSPYLLTPYKGKSLPADKEFFNHTLSRNRITIERSFALLKGRWRKLRSVNIAVDGIPNLITACCVLHNICIVEGDMLEFDEPRIEDPLPMQVPGNRTGAIKRDSIKDMLSHR